MKTDWHQPVLSGLLLLSLAGCNDGGIVGTGTGENADTSQLATDITAAAAAEGAAAAAFPEDSEMQQQFCATLPLDIAANLSGSAVTVPATWQREGSRAFSCRWEVPAKTGATQVVIEINGNPDFGMTLTSNADGRYSDASVSVINNGYKITNNPCLSGIVIPASEALWVTVSRENRQACEAGTDQPATIEALNAAGGMVVSALNSIP